MKIMKMTLMVSLVSKINMARNRIAVHPIGYKKNDNSTKKLRIFGKPFHKIQSIVTVTKTGAEIVKNIVHSMDNKPRKGRTLSEMVYESYKA